MSTSTRFASMTGALVLASLLATHGSAFAASAPKIVSGSGNISPLLEQYRTLLGDNLGNKPPAKKGRREINWDGIPDDKAAPAILPADIFKVRGVLLTTPGEGVQASARAGNPAGTLPRFGNVNPTYVNTFTHFSAERLFSPIGSNAVDVTFVVPGSNRPAVVKGFGAVYVDVDQEHTAFEFFDAKDKSLGRFAVPANNRGSRSWRRLCQADRRPCAHRLRYRAARPDDSADHDVAVIDDFIYDERSGAVNKVARKKPKWN